MSVLEELSETRFSRTVLGAWWIAVAVLGVLRMMQGDVTEALILLLSASLTAALGVALSIDRQKAEGEGETAVTRLNKGALFFTVIAVVTVIAVALLKGALWWAAMEIAALIWILPAVVLPLAEGFIRRRWGARLPAEA